MEIRTFKSDSLEPGVRVFVAEDNASDIFWLEMVFKSARIAYTIELAVDGAAAKNHLAKIGAGSPQSPQAIFLDMHMPGATAHDILDGLPKDFPIPVFILSGSDLSHGTRERFGDSRCLTKPITHEQLLACLSSIGLLKSSERSAA